MRSLAPPRGSTSTSGYSEESSKLEGLISLFLIELELTNDFRDSFSKDKTMMYLRCNTCPKEPCKWRAKIRLLKPEIKIEYEFVSQKRKNFYFIFLSSRSSKTTRCSRTRRRTITIQPAASCPSPTKIWSARILMPFSPTCFRFSPGPLFLYLFILFCFTTTIIV